MNGKYWDCETECTDLKRKGRNCTLYLDDPEVEYVDKQEGTVKWTEVICKSSTDKFSLTVGGFRFKVCPVAAITVQSSEFIRLFALCKQMRCLPKAGGLLDQDNKIIDAFSIIGGELAKIESTKSKTLPKSPPQSLSKKR